ncbi:MAG TPA: FprA family A-type flavoprotein [Anaerohalosphaeraceae bacterium]|nr:FprA family A-type flavoprotein [Phycisphaerae bacterium]HOK95681.1 FprA family A-type flavoprotein [Anaerohalosphaeraceae bacterium]HOL32252.1 FprA family A-type flavoprotein [Anaerohalosphaeraceae bacterium]HOM76304.1 FprA family A-type flavoprotein [Anaerohalosphaeraceae bacterium]HPC64494.1 FprA family A-type flavoprotein [Anaerohalosphaeraceae bacterium]
MKMLADNVLAVGVQHWDRRLFDELIPLPDGTSYNAYLVKGSQKTALLDTVDPEKIEALIDHLMRAGAEKIDYIVSHHAEQDHSGGIPDMLMMYPEAKVVANPKCKAMLMDHLHIDADVFIEVQDGQSLSLGDKTLHFLYTPWVHWPETMTTWLPEDKILFSCDFFGSHQAASNLFVQDEARTLEAAKRYYGEIMMPFRSSIRSNLKKLEPLDIRLIAPSHGPVYQKPELIIHAYKDWTDEDKVANAVVLPYVSMHGSTGKMATYLVEALMERGIDVHPFNLSAADIGEIVISLVSAATVVMGIPTVLTGAHPSALYCAALVNALRPKTKFVGIIGSYGWGSKMVEQISSLLGNVKAEMLEPVLAKGQAQEETYSKLDALADTIAAKHRQLGIA